jgi:hypothetical protein
MSLRSKIITNVSSNSLVDPLGNTSVPAPVAVYDFENGSLINKVDGSSGTQSGTLDFFQERRGVFVRGDGQGHIDLGSFDSSSGSFFTSFYYKHETGTGTKYLTGLWQDSADNFDLLLSGNNLYVYDDIDAAATIRYVNTLLPGQIYHIAYGIDSSNVCKLWVNGVPSDNDESASSSISTVSGSISLLTTGGSSALRVSGGMANVEIYNTDLTDDDVTNIYNRSNNVISYFDQGVRASETVFTGLGTFIENTPFQIVNGSSSIKSELVNGSPSKITVRSLTDYSFAHYGEFGVSPIQAAYGTWQFTMKYVGGGQARMIINSNMSDTSYNGFFVRIFSGNIELWRNLSAPFISYGTAPTSDTWYTVRLTRDYKNLFKMWVKPEGGEWFYCGSAANSFYTSASYFGLLQLSGECSVVLSSDNPEYRFWYSPCVMGL